MMRRVFTAAATLCLTASVALADWKAQTGADMMTDEKWAAMAGETDLGTLFIIKCWEKGNIQAVVPVGPYDASASFGPRVTAKFRVDEGEPFEIMMSPTNIKGFLAMGAADDDARTIFKNVAAAKERVIVVIDNGAMFLKANAHGVAKAAEALSKLCKFPDSSKSE